MEIEAKNSLVIARRGESLDWVASLDEEFTVYIYNLGELIEDDAVLDRVDRIVDMPGLAGPSVVFLHHILAELGSDDGITVFVSADAAVNTAAVTEWLAHCVRWSDAGVSGSLSSETGSVSVIYPSAKQFPLDIPGQLDLPAFLRAAGLDSLAEVASLAATGSHNQELVFAAKNSAIRAIGNTVWQRIYQLTSGDPAKEILISRLWLHLLGVPFGRDGRSSPQTVDSSIANRERADQIVGAANAAGLQAERVSALAAEISKLSAAVDIQRQAISQLVQIVGTVVASSVLPRRRQRLFISTGYFATAVAATVLQQLGHDYDNHLLIVLDRQDAAANKRWAYEMFSSWASVKTVTHIEYYVNKSQFQNPFGIDFNEVYSPDITVTNFVRAKFKAERYHFFEEGLSTYDHIKQLTVDLPDVLTYLLLPELVRGDRATPIAIDSKRFRDTIRKSSRYYQIPIFERDRNIILLATGVPVDAAEKRHHSFAFFEDVVAQLKAEGYRDIWLKPHPRVEIRDIYPSSNLATQGVRLLETDAPLIEAIVESNPGRIDLILSVYSSFSVYSEPLFGIKSRRVEGTMINAYQRDLKSLQDGHVRPARE